MFNLIPRSSWEKKKSFSSLWNVTVHACPPPCTLSLTGWQSNHGPVRRFMEPSLITTSTAWPLWVPQRHQPPADVPQPQPGKQVDCPPHQMLLLSPQTFPQPLCTTADMLRGSNKVIGSSLTRHGGLDLRPNNVLWGQQEDILVSLAVMSHR